MNLSEKQVYDFKEMYEDPFTSIEEIAEKFGLKVKQSVYNLAHKKGFVRGRYYDVGYIKCSTCKNILNANTDNFYVNKKTKSGFGYECKSCAKKRTRELYNKKKQERGK